MKEEIKLILLSVLSNKTEEEKLKIDELYSKKLDWAWILGELLRHRLNGYFFTQLTDKQKMAIYYKALQSLEILSNYYSAHNNAILAYIESLFSKFEQNNINFAGLKGVIFNSSIYNLSVRKSNDVDILVCESDLKKIDMLLREEGFIQSLDGGKTEANKKEKLIQIMNYHDLVPYYKRVGDYNLKLDINFQFVGKNDEITKDVLSYGTEIYTGNGYRIRGLNRYTHLCHLAVHFYRETTNTLWTDTHRDLEIYKLVDIENTIRKYTLEDLNKWLEIAFKFKLERQCYFMLHYLNRFYPNERYCLLMSRLKPVNENYLNEITIGTTEKTKNRDTDFLTDSFNMTYKLVVTEGKIRKDFS